MDIRERIKKMASGEINLNDYTKNYEKKLKQEQEEKIRQQRMQNNAQRVQNVIQRGTEASKIFPNNTSITDKYYKKRQEEANARAQKQIESSKNSNSNVNLPVNVSQNVQLPVSNSTNKSTNKLNLPSATIVKENTKAKEYKKGDLYKLTNGKTDDRTEQQKNFDNAIAPIANAGVGVISVFPSVASYADSAYKQLSKLSVEKLANRIVDEDKAKLIGDVAGSALYENAGRGLIFGDSVKDSTKAKEEMNKANEWVKDTIQSNINKTTNPLSKKVAEIAPSVGQNILPMGVSLINPAAGTALFMTSAGGNYLDDAKARGMNEDEAFGYATVMGIAEGGSEALISGGMLSSVKKAITGTGLSNAFLNSLGTQVTENFLQESLMEPLQEVTAQTIGGKDTANWDNIVGRSIQSGLDGLLSAFLLKGTSVGIVSSQNVLDKINNGQTVTEQEIQTVMNDIKNSGKVDIEDTINGFVKGVKENKSIFNSSIENLQQKQANEQVTTQEQQITQEENKMAQNETSEQINSVENEKTDVGKIKIKEEVTNSYAGEIFLTKTAQINGKDVGKIEYSVYNNRPSIKMIEVMPEYRRQGIATKLLQNLQEEYKNVEIDFGMTTDDGTKFLNSVTYKMPNKEIQKKKQRIDEITNILSEYEIKSTNGTLTEAEGENWNKLYDEKRRLEDDIWNKNEFETFVKLNDIANNQQTLYNNNESESGINERYTRNIDEGRNRLYEEQENQQNREYDWQEYNKWEESIKPIEANQLTDKERQSINKAKSEYNKDVVLYDTNNNDNTYSGGASQKVKNKITISRQKAEVFGIDNMIEHEVVESDILHNDKARDILSPIIDLIQEDNNFNLQKDNFWKGQEGNIPSDSLIAKDIICDRFAEIKNGEKIDYENVLNNSTNANIDMALTNYYKQVYGKELEIPSSFSMQQENNTQEYIPKEAPYSGEVGEIIQNNKERATEEKIARILDEVPTQENRGRKVWAIVKASLLDKGIVFEELSLKTGNRELQGKWDYTLTASARGQYAIGNARYEYDSNAKTKKQISKSLTEIMEEVGENATDFYDYMYHQLNIDRMTLEERFGGDTGINYERKNTIKNKPVFGDSVTAEISQKIVNEYEAKYPEFKDWAKDVYDYNNADKQELVKNGVISQEFADQLSEMYPHYVPIKRVNTKGNAIKVALDTNRTGINSPLARAKGGNQDILPLFETMADRTLQTYRASARNNFGVELKNTLGSVQEVEQTDVESIMEDIGDQENNAELLKEGKNGNLPTFTVFENGKKVTFEVTHDIYDALKPLSDSSLLSKTFKPTNKLSKFMKASITEYNPLFSIINSIKDAKEVLHNSQHAAKTYAKFPEAYAQIVKNEYWYKEYVQNGGEQNSYFNRQDGRFESNKKQKLPMRILKAPLNGISFVNRIIETAPRLAEYIASRERGASVETSMLDASRVTTNFKAGGNVTKWADRNGATFLNASIQGAMQQVRNIREAHAKGFKGYAVLLTKFAIAGVPTLVFNSWMWGDDEDYEELQDYVKDSYICIAKTEDGKFIRIPKGRTEAVIQKLLSNVGEYITGDKEISVDNFAKDFWENLQFSFDNLAPNNPIDNNVLSPIKQVVDNKSWYGEDIVPTRLQDKPKAEQYDESIDSFSIWLGKQLNQSPYKINYLLDQYGGGISDIVLPMMTKQAENNVIEDKFTTDAVMKNKYPGEFYEKLEEITTKGNSDKATDKDILQSKYANDISNSMSDLYKEKREIQNSNLSDEEKKAKLKTVQKQINDIAKNALGNIEKLTINKNTATIGENQYYKITNLKEQTPEWKKLSDEEIEKNKNISLSTYADYKERIAKETINQRENGAIKEEGSLKDKDKISILLNSKYSNKEKEALYENYIKSSKDTEYPVIKSAGIDITQYLKYKQQEFESDYKDDGTLKGKTVSKSKQNKVVNYLNSMNITGNQRLLLYAMNGYSTTASQKKQLANYVYSLNMKKQEKLELYDKFSGFKVYKDGTVKW